jgi:hypothetical protein
MAFPVLRGLRAGANVLRAAAGRDRIVGPIGAGRVVSGRNGIRGPLAQAAVNRGRPIIR